MEDQAKPKTRQAIPDSLIRKFVNELTALRQGEGVRDLDKVANLSREFRQACGVSLDTDNLHLVQEAVTETLDKLLVRVNKPEDRQAFRVAFNLDDGLRPGVVDRRGDLASTLSVVKKSIQNRENRAILQITSHLAGLFRGAGKEDSDNRQSGDEPPGAVVVHESPFARDLHLDGFYWEDLSVHITFVPASDRYEVVEHHWIVATRDGLDRVGFVVSPAFFVADGEELLADEDSGGTGWRRSDTVDYLSEDIAIRTMWLDRPFSTGERIWLIRTYYLRLEACCYIVTPLGPFGRLEVNFNGHGIFGDEAGDLRSWVVPGTLPQFVPQLVTQPPFDIDGPPEPTDEFQPQHYCWVNLPSYDADENSDYVTRFESLTPGLSYGIGWSIDKNETPRPQPDTAEDGESVSG